MTNALEVKQLSCGYGAHMVLNHIDMIVKSGCLTAIIGPNGHGKTTLLRALSGLIPKAKGSISLFGEPIEKSPAHQRVMSGLVHVPQGDLLFTDMTVLENLMAGGFHHNRIDFKRHLDDVYALFPKLFERQDQKTASLSGGERRMVGIGRGLMQGGRVLMLDEPSLGLAPSVIDQIYSALATLKSDGRSVVLVEENPSRIEDLADQVVLIDDGRIAWSGQGNELSANQAVMSTYLGGGVL